MKGLVIGKFYPPHDGHHYLIDTALANTEELDVLVCDHRKYSIHIKKRVAWLAERHPEATVRAIPDIENDEDSAAWAHHTKNFLGYTPDVVFSSEDYGDEYAKLMNAVHIKLDKDRTTVPVSATRIRNNFAKYNSYLEKNVKADLVTRIVVVGAESTGTTTLTKALADHYKTPWAQEYGRYYSESLSDLFSHNWNTDEFAHIAATQQAMEDALAVASNGVLFCDTNAFATCLWHERYMDFQSKEVENIGSQSKVHLYILTAPDIPFVQDGVRDGEHLRHAMHINFKKRLESMDIPYILVKGTLKQRLQQSISTVNNLLKETVAL